jgi:hypothetical protein
MRDPSIDATRSGTPGERRPIAGKVAFRGHPESIRGYGFVTTGYERRVVRNEE